MCDHSIDIVLNTVYLTNLRRHPLNLAFFTFHGLRIRFSLFQTLRGKLDNDNNDLNITIFSTIKHHGYPDSRRNAL